MTRGFSFDEIFPDRWLHAEDLQGKAVTVTIKDAYLEELRSPTGEKSQCAILAFEKTRKEYVLNKSNGLVCKHLWGDEAAKWIGHRLVLEPAPEQMSPSGYKIVFAGSPDIEADVTVGIGAGKKRLIRATRKGAEVAVEDAADAEFLSATETDGKASRQQQNRIRGLIKKSGLSETEWRDYAQEVAGTDVVEDMTPDGAAQFVEFLSGSEGRLAVEP